MSDSTQAASGGIGFFGVLFCVFLVLKLVGTVTWSWWWVTAPLWGPWVAIIAVIAVVIVAHLIARVVP
jgi:hypothetical protein